jgi:hypothetical protein
LIYPLWKQIKCQRGHLICPLWTKSNRRKRGRKVPVKIIERDDGQVGPPNGGIEVRLVADDEQPEHRLHLSVETARELVRLLMQFLQPLP